MFVRSRKFDVRNAARSPERSVVVEQENPYSPPESADSPLPHRLQRITVTWRALVYWPILGASLLATCAVVLGVITFPNADQFIDEALPALPLYFAGGAMIGLVAAAYGWVRTRFGNGSFGPEEPGSEVLGVRKTRPPGGGS